MNSNSRKPKEGWQQQNCANFMFIPSRTFGICLYAFIAVTNIVIGIVLMHYSNQIQQYRQEYFCNSHTCTVSVNVDSNIPGPVYIYYEIEGFYQNHRIYFKSRYAKQLAGAVYSSSDLSDCSPVTKVQDLDLQNSNLAPSLPADPCGLVAKSYFQDTFAFENGINIRQTGIAWPTDTNGKYKNAPNWEKIQWQDVENERFIVWMRTSATNDFVKLWGILDQDLNQGVYNIIVHEKMDYTAFGGKKFIVLSNANAFGGKNNVLVYAFLASGGLAAIWTLFFIFYPCFLKNSRLNH
jgi:LEM3 (ligand-effect modulator 3) family / CDC50 family